MTDLAASTALTPAAPSGASTVLDPAAPAQVSGGGAPDLSNADAGDKSAKAPSLRDVIAEEAAKSAKASEEKGKDDAATADKSAGGEDGKASGKEAKPRGSDGKFASADAKGGDKGATGADAALKAGDGATDVQKGADAAPAANSGADAKAGDDPAGQDGAQKDDGRHFQPPKRLMPDSVEKWTNVPRSVQRDIDAMVREHAAETDQLRRENERYGQLREYDQLAQSNGRDLRESLAKMSEVEDLLQTNPYAGLQAILKEIGPRRPDGTTPSLFEVAQFVVQQGPDGFQRLVAARPQGQQQQAPDDPRVEALQKQLVEERGQRMAESVIEPFKAAHPRYEELRGDIAFFLQSGRVPASLSAPERLAVAYDMAERLNPPSNVSTPAPSARPDETGRVDDSSGSKSIKSTPGSTSQDAAPSRGGSIRDLLTDELKRQRG